MYKNTYNDGANKKKEQSSTQMTTIYLEKIEENQA